MLHPCLYPVVFLSVYRSQSSPIYTMLVHLQSDLSKLFCFSEMPSLHLLIFCRLSILRLQVPLLTMKAPRVPLVSTTTASTTPGALLVAVHLLHFESDGILDFLSAIEIVSR